MVGESMEEFWFLGTKESIVDLIYGLFQLGIALIVLTRIVAVQTPPQTEVGGE